MADSNSRDDVVFQYDCAENGEMSETVCPNYAEIIVIRHGETEWNADRRIQGHLDVDLNDVGRQQAVVVAERLSREPKISAVYSSDLKRAFYTAEIIAKSCAVTEVTKDPDLRERHLGDLQGAIFNDIAKVNPEAHKAFLSDRDDQEIAVTPEVVEGSFLSSTQINVNYLTNYIRAFDESNESLLKNSIAICPSLLPLILMVDSFPRTSGLGECENTGPKYAEIIVIRHGETEWNIDRRIQGQLDTELNDVGKWQALKLAERISREPKISAIYSSDLKRALYTADIIAQACGVIEVIKDPELRERHMGDLQGVIFREAFLPSQNDIGIPGGGESFNQLYKRCTSAFRRIAEKHIGERVVVVSHGAVIEALIARASPRDDCHGKIRNASINIFHVSDQNRCEWSIISWGDVRHLK